eukprot:2401288-Prymnesium_polylepis.2
MDGCAGVGVSAAALSRALPGTLISRFYHLFRSNFPALHTGRRPGTASHRTWVPTRGFSRPIRPTWTWNTENARTSESLAAHSHDLAQSNPLELRIRMLASGGGTAGGNGCALTTPRAGMPMLTSDERLRSPRLAGTAPVVVIAPH